MLIRHISIPRKGYLATLKEPKQTTEKEEQVDYSSHLVRTLNPEHSSQDVLVDDKPIQQLRQQPTTSLFQTFAETSLLTQEHPQKMEEVKKGTASLQQTQQHESRHENKARTMYRIKENGSALSNNAYLQQPQRQNSHQLASFEHVNNRLYLEEHPSPTLSLRMKEKEGEGDVDESLVNHHSKMAVKNREVYRTIEKFKDKSQLREAGDQNSRQRKYNMSLPKQISKDWLSSREQIKDCPLEVKKTRRGSGISGFSNRFTQKQGLLHNENKRRAMPLEEEDEQIESASRRFNQTIQPRNPRRTSEQESIIHTKPESEATFTNKHLKKHSSLLQTPKPPSPSPPKSIEISYRLSLTELREICCLPSLQVSKLTIKIPQILAYPLFTGNQEQEQLFKKASELVKHLQLPVRKEISIKKYTNCILIVVGSLAIVWNYSGKVYLGGWRYRLLDEGEKSGLGLEWSPNKWVYYGEFSKNRRQGVGIMKNSSQLSAGIWKDNKFIRSMGQVDEASGLKSLRSTGTNFLF